jgi:hypothetical protein
MFVPTRNLLVVVVWIFTAAGAAEAWAQATKSPGHAFFEQKIRPILVEHCYSCHSQEAQQKKKLQAELFLDSQEGILYGGESGPALVKGKSSESLLIKALKYDGVEMPPTGQLPESVIADFAKWIDMGAPDPRIGRPAGAPAKRVIDVDAGRTFWSFRPLMKVGPPTVRNSDWCRTPIDRFIVAAQEQQGLTPNATASPEILVRRAYFDLVGLPPSPEDVAAFVADQSPDAYSKLIDKLLASPQYGERWGRHWLDVARYAESGGYEFDGFRAGAYHYRDWVIRALNDDLPYDEFVRMQIAGDKLRPGDYRAASASGFLVAGPYPGQITAKTVERIRYDQLDDMLMTTGGSMLGLTLGCVRCHDHKYDPIPAKDYYGLASVLARTSHGNARFDPDPKATQQALARHAQEQATLVAAVRKYAATELPDRFAKWQKQELPKLSAEPHWQVLAPLSNTSNDTWLTSTDDGLVVHITGGRRKDSDKYTITAETYQRNITSIRLDALTDPSLPKKGPGFGANGSFALGDFKLTARPLDPHSKDRPIVLKLKAVHAAFEEKSQLLANAVDQNPATFWRANAAEGKDNAGIFEIEGGLPGFVGGTAMTFELAFVGPGLGRLRVAISTEPNPATWAGEVVMQHLGEIKALIVAGKQQLAAGFQEPMVRWFSRYDDATRMAYAPLQDHIRRTPRVPFLDVYTSVSGGQDVYFLRRGEVDNKQELASPAFIQVLTTAKSGSDEWLTKSADGKPAVDPRIAMARWMTDTEHGAGQLLARVMVNRLWQHHFGEGIVGTPNDFGAQGDRPTHPELLDWLAGELIRSDWRLKPLHKQIMTSAAYMQAGEVTEANRSRDTDNRYLWHRKPRRLEAEMIRDALLAVGGTLDQTMYDPSVMDSSSRRSVYLRVKRSELIPLMTLFDAPEPTQSIGERASTTVPTQALTLMNSPFVRQTAEALAKRIRTPAKKDAPLESAIDNAYSIALSRRPSSHERTKMRAFIDAQTRLLGGGQENEDKAIVEFCQVLLCVNEFVYID